LKVQAPSSGVRILEGSYYEIGLQLGATLETLQIPEATAERKALAASCEALIAERYPALLDKVEGMIAASRLRSEDFKAFFYARDLSSQMGCTNLAVLPGRTRDDSILVGVNYDWYFQSQEWREIRGIRPEGALTSVRVTHHWAGSPDGINEAGLGVFLSVLPQDRIAGPGLPWHLVTDIMLETCQSVTQARDFLDSIPRLRAFNYLVTDALGQAMVLEALPRSLTIREAQDGFLLATNHLPGREVAEEKLSEEDKRRQRRSLARYERVKEILGDSEAAIDEAAMKTLLMDHEAPICRGSHDPVAGDTSYDNVFGTIWSLVARPGRGDLQVAWGHPCQSEYVSYGPV
jgi:predicted choloylglycine hydrolase